MIRYNKGVSAPCEDELLEVALRAARAAGTELLSRFGKEAVDVRSKSTPTDPVSAADVAAEEAIRAVLAEARPADAILGEEGGETAGNVSAGGGAGAAAGGVGTGLRWVVDPLDGTVNYLYGIPTFAVSVACEDRDGTIVGAVLNPVSGECFSATRSGPAFRNGIKISASICESFDRALVATGFGYDPAVRAVQGQVVTRILPRARDIRRAGAAALDLCSCACGRVDAYYERGVKPWDIAAGALLCKRVGLLVRPLAEVHGVEVPGISEPVTLPSGIAVAPPALIEELLTLVA
jgi:myo-inositol-1(or 4)-monophosphatase